MPSGHDKYDFAFYDVAGDTESLYQGILQATRDTAIDVMVTFEPFNEGQAAARAKRATGLPLVHVGMHIAHNNADKKAEQDIYAAADGLIFQCHWFPEHYLTDRYRSAYIEGKPTVVAPFGVDTQFFTPKDDASDSKKAKQILFAGRLNRENCRAPEYDKGAAYLIRSMPEVLNRIPDAHAQVIGDGPQLDMLKAEAQALGVTASVEFSGQVASRQGLLEAMHNSSLFVLPSVCDVFPVAILEAMAAGLPVVSTIVGGIDECIDGSCGALVKSKDPSALAEVICDLLGNDTRREQLGREARQRAIQRHDWRVAASEIASLLTRLHADA